MTEQEAKKNDENCRTADQKMAADLKNPVGKSDELADEFSIRLNEHQEAHLQLTAENQRLKEEIAQKDAFIADHERRDEMAVARAAERDKLHQENMERIASLCKKLQAANVILEKLVPKKKAQPDATSTIPTPVATVTTPTPVIQPVAPTTAPPATPTAPTTPVASPSAPAPTV